ncbi:hypothetical protein PanWU01x14_129810 [Parasponia andersonii]|uniref:Uncharacterized protein n=1 Tax=Parasponia andersonii TaxID=3476 RepID=A0A2P5CRG7_PARAD|nr:hypothetical protein PanWU01x14_129810 [Parasponia andersonii]
MDFQNFTIFFFFVFLLMWRIPNLQWAYFQLQDALLILRSHQEVVVGHQKILSTTKVGNLQLLCQIS